MEEIIISKIFILGSGSWGSALTLLLLKNEHNVCMYLNRKKTIKNNINDEKIIYTKNFNEIKNYEFILITLPSYVININMLNIIKEHASNNSVIIIASKGLYYDNKNNIITFSQLFEKHNFSSNKICVMTGPTHAEEIKMQLPSAILIACKDYDCAYNVLNLFKQKFFDIYISKDILGAELGGSLKNIIALGAGISDGLKLGNNFKAALITRGLQEIIKLGKNMGASEKTFMGLSGLGDIIVTCNSMHSRNYRAGLLIAENKSQKEIFDNINETIEGYHAIQAAILLGKKYSTDMPITNILNKIINEKYDAKNILNIFSKKQSYYE